VSTFVALVQEYGPQALAAVGGGAGLLKGGAWVAGKIEGRQNAKKEAREEREKAEHERREAEREYRDEVRSGLRALNESMTELSGRVENMQGQLEAHDKRTRETAELVRMAAQERHEFFGEMRSRVARAENDASTARHVASEANALATNAHQRLDERIPRTLDTVTPGFGRPSSKG